jgi:hypothetical protein
LSTRSRRKLSVISRGSVVYTEGSPVSRPESWEDREPARLGAKPFPTLDCHALSLPNMHLQTQVPAVRAITWRRPGANGKFVIPRRVASAPTVGAARPLLGRFPARGEVRCGEARNDIGRRCGPIQRLKSDYFEEGRLRPKGVVSTRLADGGW